MVSHLIEWGNAHAKTARQDRKRWCEWNPPVQLCKDLASKQEDFLLAVQRPPGLANLNHDLTWTLHPACDPNANAICSELWTLFSRLKYLTRLDLAGTLGSRQYSEPGWEDWEYLNSALNTLLFPSVINLRQSGTI